tara:strand:- start:4469 stop:4798 length:330 start_codon:yes stop_codon:yes gene_type:complete
MGSCITKNNTHIYTKNNVNKYMNIIYAAYKDPPEPPKHLWLEIDLSKISFKTNKDLDYVQNVVIRYNPELYLIINKMYKVHQKNKQAYLKIINKYEVNKEPKLMRKNKK